jgi:hypothetical protein
MQQAVENIRQAEEEKISTRRQKKAQRAAEKKTAADARLKQLATPDEKTVTKDAETNAALRIGLLKGEEKIRAEYAEKQRVAQKALNVAKTDAERQMIRERMALLDQGLIHEINTMRKAADEKVKQGRAANTHLRIELLKGEAKIRAEYGEKQRAERATVNGDTTADEKKVIAQRIDLLGKNRDREIADFRKTAEEKEKALGLQLATKRGDLDKIGGRGVNANALEQMGAGGFGVDRSGFGAADRVFRVQQEQATHLAEIERLTSELLQATLDATGGGI